MDDKEINRALEELIGRFLARQKFNEPEPNKALEEFISHFFARLDACMVSVIQRANDTAPQKSAPKAQNNLLTVREAADLLSMTVTGVYHWVSDK